MPILIAITGGSGSGKSTLAEALVASLPEGAAVLLREDSYYRDAAGLPDFDPATFDFDDVAARDHELMIRDLTELKAGRDVLVPLYSFIHHGREPGGEPAKKKPKKLSEKAPKPMDPITVVTVAEECELLQPRTAQPLRRAAAMATTVRTYRTCAHRCSRT